MFPVRARNRAILPVLWRTPILRSALTQDPQGPRNLGTAINDQFKLLGGVVLPEVPRESMLEPPSFD